MAALPIFDERAGMATRWRRRRLCVLIADRPAPAALTRISAVEAVVETSLRPPVGSEVELRHPEAGRIVGRVRATSAEGVVIAFPCSAGSVGFALAAIAADMSRPAVTPCA